MCYDIGTYLVIYILCIISAAMAKTAGFKVQGDRGFFSENIFVKSHIDCYHGVCLRIPYVNHVYETVNNEVAIAPGIMCELKMVRNYNLTI
jgi:uncharacterized membrane protein